MPFPLAHPATERPPAAVSSHPTARGRVDAPGALRLWHVLSLDAPTVAVVWSLAFARVIGIHLPVWVPILLALGTWSVYVGDRLLDAHKALLRDQLELLRERHFFHWRNRRWLLPCAGFAALMAAGLIVTRVPVSTRQEGAVVGCAALAYFSSVHLPRLRLRPLSGVFSKEFVVGILFTAGCALPSISRLSQADGDVSVWALAVVIGFFAALAWLNCSAIDCWESMRRVSIAGMGGLLGSAGLTAALLMGFAHLRGAALLLAGALSACLLAYLDHRRSRLTLLALRATADLVLLTPLILLMR